MDVRRLQYIWKHVKRVKPWYLFVLAGISLIIGIVGLRANNLRMAELRDAVYQADKDGGDVQGALTNLQRYVTSHMNTNLSGGSDNAVYPPIQLKYTYERLQDAEAQKSNGAVYTEAQAHCERLNPTDFSGRSRIPCIQEYVQSRGVQQQVIPDALYKFDFLSPAWSPDMAGFGLLFAGLFALAGGVLWLVRRLIRRV
ncbi:MAG TPA: hypothetical protein VK978_04735 [Candidatus Saccharimonadales bacterium]|nr:hypothetical protein [Candidatus Saccharimonadales bacterium]